VVRVSRLRQQLLQHERVYAFHRTEGLYETYPHKPFMFPEWGMTLDDPAYVKAFATFIRRHRRARFASFFNGPTGGAYDLGTKPRSRAVSGVSLPHCRASLGELLVEVGRREHRRVVAFDEELGAEAFDRVDQRA
jgi:hypothetical protein